MNVADGDVAVLVLPPVQVTVSVPVHAADGVVVVADQLPVDGIENPVIVALPEQPPPNVALVRPDGAVPV